MTGKDEMMDILEVKKWIDTLEVGNQVAIDDGGMCLVELTTEGSETGAYIEIGGTSEPEEV
jgi:hypothetical protein